MKRMIRTLLLTLLLALLAGCSPIAKPSEESAITDEGNNFFLVDGTTELPLPNLLAGAELAKLVALRSAPRATEFKIDSAVSPDGQAFLATHQPDLFFVNVDEDAGAAVPVASDKPLAAFTNYIWLDDYSLGYITSLPEPTADGKYVGASVDRRTGVVTKPEPRLASAAKGVTENILPVLLSPDGSKFLLADLSNAEKMKLGYTGPQLLDSAGAAARGGLSFSWDSLPTAARFGLTAGAKLFVLDVASGVKHDVLTASANTVFPDVTFSADGNRLSVTSNSTGDAMDRSFDGVRMPEAAYRDAMGELAPEENVFYQSTVVTVLDFPSGIVKTLRPAAGDYVMFNGTSWSTDSRLMVVEVNTPGLAAGRQYPQFNADFHSGGSLRIYDADLNEVQRLESPEVDAPVKDARFISADEILVQTRFGTNGHPYIYNVGTAELRNIADRPGAFFEVTHDPVAKRLVFVYSSYTDPPEYARIGLDGTGFTKLTNLHPEAAAANTAKQYPVAFTLENGEVFDGVLILPGDVSYPPQNQPLVLWEAGGPMEAVLSSWQIAVETPQALLANFGIGVLVTPLYGRYGLGAERFNALADNDNFGRIDIDAQVEIAEQVRALGWADKVGIAGCSYGGYIVTQSITQHPDAYDAANTMCSIVDMVTEWSRGDGRLLPWLTGATIYDAPEEYVRISPIYHTRAIRTPLLAFHGTKDFLPVSVMENFMTQVMATGTPAKLLKLQDAGHSTASTMPATLSDTYEDYITQEQVLWFREYLGQ